MPKPPSGERQPILPGSARRRVAYATTARDLVSVLGGAATVAAKNGPPEPPGAHSSFDAHAEEAEVAFGSAARDPDFDEFHAATEEE
jgi:hypothetical protein